MFSDIDFFQRYIDRFQSLRRAEFSKGNINAIIDGMADELKEAQKRDQVKWNRRPRSAYGGTYQGEVNHMKTWLSQRDFLHGTTVRGSAGVRTGRPGTPSPARSSASNQRRAGKSITHWTEPTPRRAGGTVAAKAILYAGRSIQNKREHTADRPGLQDKSSRPDRLEQPAAFQQMVWPSDSVLQHRALPGCR